MTKRRASRGSRRAGSHTPHGAQAWIGLRWRSIALAGGIAAAVVALVVTSAIGDDGDAPVALELSAAERAELRSAGQRIAWSIDRREPAPALRVQTASFADGSVFDLAEERGNVVIVYFMAGWCLTCIPEAQALALLHEQYADQGLRIVVMDVEQTERERDLLDFRERAGNGQHRWAMDADFRVARAFEVNALDSTVVIDRDGRIAYQDASPTAYETLRALIETLL